MSAEPEPQGGTWEGGPRDAARDARALLAPLVDSRPWRQLLAGVEARSAPVCGGVTGSLFSLVAAGLADEVSLLLVLVPGDDEAEGVTGDLELLGTLGVVLLPSGRDAHAERARVVAGLQEEDGGPRVVVGSVRSVVDPLPTADSVRASRLELRVGARLERDEIVQRLADAGFEAEAVVQRSGTFSARGDVVDFFPHDHELPLRVELFDDEVEGLRRFDPSTQLSVEVLKEARPSLLGPSEPTTEGWLADHLGEDTVVLSRDVPKLEEALQRHLARYEDGEREVRREAWEDLRKFRDVLTTRIKAPPSEAVNLGGRIIAADGSTFESAVNTLARVTQGKQVSWVCFESPAERDRFFELLAEEESKLEAATRVRRRRPRGVVGRWHEGFHSPFLGIAACSRHELFATNLTRRPRKEREASQVVTQVVESFLDLEPGDFVVHVAHGIARFVGLERVEKGGTAQDFLAIEFKDEVRLLVPASKVDLIQKYIGGKGEAPELSRLGGKTWARRKKAVAEGVSDFAAELLELQALRARKPGIRHPPDTPWQQEFEAAFPYEVTADQARAVEQIKEDMESPRPMDRLICGDVGYGKTEVSMRAAFKAVMGERQVAVLVPTTVLAHQHWESFKERMANYPVVVESLSRFRTTAEQKRVIEGLRAGTVDIVIGTHRLVQKDVDFKNLGLVVIDEEQRFGVAHKERLRKLRAEVDVLVMTATPIPRTLHTSLLGLRDISPLSQAPRGRRQVKTEVVPYDPSIVKNAILRELDREGQVFFVHNRVQTIGKVAQKLQDLVPNARILVGHGQMSERALERTMLGFLAREADILVATTIIESGLDIPTVNTIFIDHADMYGLANLHQLRGRVGRYHHQAFAYFLVHGGRAVSTIAEKRLRAIEEFTELGAGFQIAMRDMEIRGAGNILGAQQSGHIAAVGYDLYCRLLDAAVKRMRNEEVYLPEEVEINVDFTAFLPDGYIPERRLRIEFYRRLGRATTVEDFEAVVKQMRDRFGRLPDVASEFVLVARIRALLERLRIARLEIMPREGVMLRPRRLRELVRRVRVADELTRILDGRILLLVHPAPFTGPGDLLAFLESSLEG